jgi:glucose 1-dehydrogenase
MMNNLYDVYLSISTTRKAWMLAKRILVTGASSGIGRAICLRLASSGADIAACGSLHGDELNGLVEELRSMGVKAFPLLGNLSDTSVPARLVSDATAVLGGLDAVVSNAGIARPAVLSELSPADWEVVFSVNVRAPWLLAVAAKPWLKLVKGSFVAVASMSGVQPYPGMGAYGPSKSALIMLTRQLAQEWAADGVRVNSLSPGLVRTPLWGVCRICPP